MTNSQQNPDSKNKYNFILMRYFVPVAGMIVMGLFFAFADRDSTPLSNKIGFGLLAIGSLCYLILMFRYQSKNKK